MLDALYAPVLVDGETERVVQRVAVRQDTPFAHLTRDGRPADLGRAEVAEPVRQVADRRVDPARPVRRKWVDLRGVAAALRRVRRCAARDDFSVVVADERLAHPERPKHVLLHPRPEGLPGDALHDLRQQEVVRVAVRELGARLEVEAPLSQRQVPDDLLCDEVAVLTPRQPQQPEGVAETARVMEELADGDGRVEAELGHERVDLVVEREPSLIGQQRNGEGRELLADGAGVEHGLRRDRHAVLQVGRPVPL